jgi:hypothetical protein
VPKPNCKGCANARTAYPFIKPYILHTFLQSIDRGAAHEKIAVIGAQRSKRRRCADDICNSSTRGRAAIAGQRRHPMRAKNSTLLFLQQYTVNLHPVAKSPGFAMP